ncbi:hypothetical protein [Gordonia sp. WA4-43]|uniref:hypothetical protein n=1 Tax=Gordonia sp. WA4-43 TaxID=2878678 RepID=UPI001CFB02B7|nr:hypothetical protein [Gordonia sp. WA4-43]UCZ88175.1 hypothetical protein LEL84_13735 [Gordonia sp. WA4-43]
MSDTAPHISDDTAEAVGKVGEALEYIERARGHLYSFHQLIGRGDLLLGEAVDELRKAGHGEFADELSTELVGRNVLEGRWTFQVVEDFDDTYWGPLREYVNRVRADLTDGQRHVHEARMKEDRRTQGHPEHTANP